MTDYLAWLERERGLRFDDYAALWRWSVDDLEALLDVGRRLLRDPAPRRVEPRPGASASMPGARWFEGAELNYAEAVFRRAHARSPGPPLRSPSASRCARCRPPSSGLGRGRRGRACGGSGSVAATGSWRSSRTSREAVVAFLACASIGAIWACCSPDFGTRSLIDRFAQIAPEGAPRRRRLHLRRQAVRPARRDRGAARGAARRSSGPCSCRISTPTPTPTGPARWPGPTSSPDPPSRSTFEPVPFDHPLVDPLFVGHDRAAQGDRPRPRRGRPRALEGGRAACSTSAPATGCSGSRRPAG